MRWGVLFHVFGLQAPEFTPEFPRRNSGSYISQTQICKCLDSASLEKGCGLFTSKAAVISVVDVLDKKAAVMFPGSHTY